MERMQNSRKFTLYRKRHQKKKDLAIDAYKMFNSIFSSKKNSIKIKLRIFNAYVSSVFLFNSKLCTLTRKLENTIDNFQRRQLRKITQESKTATRKTKHDLDSDSKARFGQSRN